MKVAPFPVNEQYRQLELESYNCMSPEPDQTLDEITKLVCSMFNAPMSVISLLDNQRQWFKSKQGIEADETPRELSICSHAILGRKVFEVYDTLSDERFSDNPILLEGKIRFYAGAPLITSSGYAIGTLCILDTKPRQITFNEKVALKVLAEYVMNVLEFDKKESAVPMQKAPENVVRVNVLRALDYLMETDTKKANLMKALIL